jgi:exonuclease III
VLKLATWNARGLRSREKFLEMVLFFEQEHLDLLGIQETLFTEANDQVRFGLAQKSLIWHNGSRGISSFQEKARTDIECLQGFSVNEDSAQILVFRVLSIDTVIVYAYLPQGSSSEGIETLWNLLGLLQQLYFNIVVMGDLNTRMNICNDGYNTAGRFLETALKNSLFYERLPLQEPTFKNQSSLDHVLVSKNLCDAAQATVASSSSVTGGSDHSAILVQLEMPEVKQFDQGRIIMNKEKAAACIERSLAVQYDFSSQDFFKSVEKFSGITTTCIHKCSKKITPRHFASK